ncbi:PRC-barrel domain-containing protein [Rhodococcus oxybenzonivorans]|uniref:PRC-barrel domain-containing protein n=1 Tax=Rhodococcus oxybenzonivorans TaxID=1990687 RepID=A0A2S2C221_9NOCA|nr:PRC-barrel domain-containing protein [Rhodococcus oxybenzonivorans]AWK74935.1 PRC-barrel domain-containing protein [Rhodococcus oxybenzonivorans]
MTESENQRTLIDLDEAALMLEHPAEDIRGRSVYDRDGHELGKIEGLIVDEAERKVRFLRIGSGGFLGFGKTARLVPVDAITRITDDAVHLDRSKEHVAGSDPYDPQVMPVSDFYRRLYEHYGYAPFWAAGYVYPYPPPPPPWPSTTT